jgi:hypothetical protein
MTAWPLIALGALACLAGQGLIGLVREVTPAMPGDLRGFFTAMVVLAATCTVMHGLVRR